VPDELWTLELCIAAALSVEDDPD